MFIVKLKVLNFFLDLSWQIFCWREIAQKVDKLPLSDVGVVCGLFWKCSTMFSSSSIVAKTQKVN